MNKKMRVWWIPQIGYDGVFYIPVESPEEAKKVMDILGMYDCFQYNHRIKPDYCNAGGVEIWDEVDQEWYDWYYDDGDCYYDDIDEYIEDKSDKAKDLERFVKELGEQVVFN